MTFSSALRNFTKFTGKYRCQSLLFDKVAGLRPVALFKKRLWHSCFPVNFAKFLRTPFLQNSSGRLFLNIEISYINHKTVFINDILYIVENIVFEGVFSIFPVRSDILQYILDLIYSRSARFFSIFSFTRKDILILKIH